MDQTLSLLTKARAGDAVAIDQLFGKYIPRLQRWAHGRLPVWARDLNDTHDLVQETVVRVFKNLEGFEYRGEGALEAYLRQALMNRLRNELRRVTTRPPEVTLDTGVEDYGWSPVDLAIGAETRQRYEAALRTLSDDDRELVIARVELGLTYKEIADIMHKPSPDAVRMSIARALVRVSSAMRT
jgi:RNA polymerase sigma-70 factor (ECF subfamily)